VTTVIIAAHNEGPVIGRLIQQLLPGAPAEMKVIVVANGCSDTTAEVAASFGPRVQVLSLPVASKHAAIAAGDQAATEPPYVYVDADVELRGQDVQALVAALRRPGILAAAPELALGQTGTPWPVRWYYDVWTRLPEVRRGLFGRGVIALTQQGRERVSGLPPVLGDDLAVSVAFAPHERCIVPETRSIVHVPRTVSGLLRRRVRVAVGGVQMEQLTQLPGRAARTRVSDLATIVRSEPRIAPRVALFLSVAVLARLRASRAVARGDFTTWLRDETSRCGAGRGTIAAGRGPDEGQAECR
jgi:Glycosyl transferase family 2